MVDVSGVRHLGAAASARGFERLLEHLIGVARVDPDRVVAEARRRGLPVAGDDPLARVASLRRLPVPALDPVAAAFVRANCVVAGAQGFVTGLGGLATLPVAVSTDTVGALYWIVRATSGVMTAYGFETESEEGAAHLRVGLLLAMGVGTIDVGGTRVLLERVSRQVLSTPHSQRLLAAGGRRLAQRIAGGAARGPAARAVPLVGGAVGGALNVGLVRSVGRRAQRHYRTLLLEWQESGPLPAPAPLPLPPGPLPLPPGPLPLPPGGRRP